MENVFKWRHNYLVMCTLVFLRYRDLEEMMSERGLSVAHTIIFRWVQHFAPELVERIRSHLKKAMIRGRSMKPKSKSSVSGC